MDPRVNAVGFSPDRRPARYRVFSSRGESLTAQRSSVKKGMCAACDATLAAILLSILQTLFFAWTRKSTGDLIGIGLAIACLSTATWLLFRANTSFPLLVFLLYCGQLAVFILKLFFQESEGNPIATTIVALCLAIYMIKADGLRIQTSVLAET